MGSKYRELVQSEDFKAAFEAWATSRTGGQVFGAAREYVRIAARVRSREHNAEAAYHYREGAEDMLDFMESFRTADEARLAQMALEADYGYEMYLQPVAPNGAPRNQSATYEELEE
jgi:hypothetical protein